MTTLEQVRKNNEVIFRSIFVKVCSHNIQKPYTDWFEELFERINADIARRIDEDPRACYVR